MKRKQDDEGPDGYDGSDHAQVQSKKRATDWVQQQKKEHSQEEQLEAPALPSQSQSPDGNGNDSPELDPDSASVASVANTSLTHADPTTTVAATSINTTTTRASRRFPSDLKTIRCTFAGCTKTFNRPARLAAHLRSHTNDRPFKCPYDDCDKDYLEEKHLSQHIKGFHTNDRKYTCPEPGCGKSFVTNTRLRRHALVHEGADRYRCRGYGDCVQSFRKHQTLQRHIRTAHIGQSAYPCGNDGCDAGFDTASALRRHVEREHGDLKFWCDECNAEAEGDDNGGRRVGFTTMLLLQAHMKKEHNNCAFCGVRCGTQNDMMRHVELYHSAKTVEDRKTIACTWEGCDKKFTRVSNLNTHIKSAHEGHRFVCGQTDIYDAKVPEIADWNFAEEGCGQGFTTRVKLEEHVLHVHLGKKRPPKLYPVPSMVAQSQQAQQALLDSRDLACSVYGCAARFIRHADLDRHIQHDHGGNGIKEEQQQLLLLPQLHAAEEQAATVPFPSAANSGVDDLGYAIDPSLEPQLQPGDVHSAFTSAGATPPPQMEQFTHVPVTDGGSFGAVPFWLGDQADPFSIQQQPPVFEDWAADMQLLMGQDGEGSDPQLARA
ncbi:hypothetical protein N0V85_001011 [Neurospora sp. IMI 360204]|nr:hypothetical protein N0V85_001011 [Neurospora sp. IMI 360204]